MGHLPCLLCTHSTPLLRRCHPTQPGPAGNRVLKQQQEVQGYLHAQYLSRLLWAPSTGGAQVPVSMAYRGGAAARWGPASCARCCAGCVQGPVEVTCGGLPAGLCSHPAASPLPQPEPCWECSAASLGRHRRAPPCPHPVSCLTRPADLVKLDGSDPLLLEAYGAYGVARDPEFSSVRLSLLDRGFIFAVAHVRCARRAGPRHSTRQSCMPALQSCPTHPPAHPRRFLRCMTQGRRRAGAVLVRGRKAPGQESHV